LHIEEFVAVIDGHQLLTPLDTWPTIFENNNTEYSVLSAFLLDVWPFRQRICICTSYFEDE
jgi:hypothetical protein